MSIGTRMERRTFLRMFSFGAACFTIDPEEFLWTPGTKHIFIPQTAKPFLPENYNDVILENILGGGGFAKHRLEYTIELFKRVHLLDGYFRQPSSDGSPTFFDNASADWQSGDPTREAVRYILENTPSFLDLKGKNM